MPLKPRLKPTIDELRAAVHYDAETGDLTRTDNQKPLFNDRPFGSLLGCSGLSRGHVAYAHYHGHWPHKIAYKNGIPLDTRLSNLIHTPAPADGDTPIDVVKYLRSLIDYDPQTGLIHWAVNNPARRRLRGQPAFEAKHTVVLGRNYLTAHLIWAHHYGELPPDHKRVLFLNGDKTDRRIDNLKLISRGISPYQGRWKVYTNSNYRGMKATLEEAEEFLELLKTRA